MSRCWSRKKYERPVIGSCLRSVGYWWNRDEGEVFLNKNYKKIISACLLMNVLSCFVHHFTAKSTGKIADRKLYSLLPVHLV